MLKMGAELESDERERTPAHARVYEELCNLILSGDLAPGQAVTIQGLVGLLGAGMTPVREAIRRLISDGALNSQGNRRVCVPELSLQDVEELIFIRKSIESELAFRASTRISPAGIAELESLDTQLDHAILSGDIKGYLMSNHAFHAALYTWAGAPIMTQIARRLWLRFGPSLRVVCGRFGTENLPDMHKDILQALRVGDASAAAAAMGRDVVQGMDQISRTMRSDIDRH